MYRILKKSGAQRVSDESADELRRIIEEVAETIAKSAVDMSVHAGRKTVKAEVVKLMTAAKQSHQVDSPEFYQKRFFEPLAKALFLTALQFEDLKDATDPTAGAAANRPPTTSNNKNP